MSPSFIFLFLFLLTILLLPSPSYSQSQQRTFHSFNSSVSPWRPDQKLTLVSNNSVFAAGFLPLSSSSPDLFSFSIWYHNISLLTLVWSAPSPLNRSSASLSISPSGVLRLSSAASPRNLLPGNATGTQNSSLSLSDLGNLVYGSNWQTFHFPSNTFLPNQTITNDTQLTSINRKFTFTNSLYLIFNSSDTYWNPANALLQLDPSGTLLTANNAKILSSDFGPTDRLRRLTLDDDGNLRIWSFDSTLNRWTVVWKALQELCKIHGSCGPNAICKYNDSMTTVCLCPAGYKPGPRGAGEGCEIKIPITEPAKTKFVRLDYINYTGGSNQSQVQAANFSMCQSMCLNNPDCLGFMFKFDGSLYCVLQLHRMLYGYWSPGTQNAMYLRLDDRETDQSNFIGLTNLLETSCPIRISLPLPPDESNTTTRNIAIICTLFAAELIAGVLFFWAFLNKYIKYRDMARTLGLELLPAGGPKRFSYAELKAATNDFSDEIGRGGFGDVYRGELPDHRIIAVKCLKKVAGGDTEFWAEVTIIARMHHLNLVRLWGFCAEKGQRILVYEYVPNGSLDKYLFRPGQVGSGENGENPKPVLDWNIRYRIALGVARAIAYLHEECLEWVLHCDIKPENILLGDDFCPKISDFGLSKLRKKEDMVSMSRIRGTRGYMAPEWVKMDLITPKADVYSFGMVLLEIVSGIRNFEVQGSLVDSEDWYFPRWAFDKVFKEMNVEDILDRQIKHCYDTRAHFDMVNRMVKTAMWCLQDRPENRPSMGKVAKMLEGTVEIMEPTKPTIFFLSDDQSTN